MSRAFQLLIASFVLVTLTSCEPEGGRGRPPAGGGGGGQPAGGNGGGEKKPAEVEVVAPANPGGAPTATIKGKIAFVGTPPQNPAIPGAMAAEPACAAVHTTPPKFEVFVIGAGGALQNVIVHVSSGLPDQKWPEPTGPLDFDQKGCVYNPHVFAVRAKQTVKIHNSDPVLHNIHMFPTKSPEYNKGMPKKDMVLEMNFRRAEPEPVRIKCDVHPWMSAYAGVFDHPYFAVSNEKGEFELPKIAPGTYVLTAWHEKLGKQTAKVTVADGETKEVPTIEFKQ